MSRLLPYETILKAREGDPEAVNAVLLHYAGYIRYFSKVNGQVNAEVEEIVRHKWGGERGGGRVAGWGLGEVIRRSWAGSGGCNAAQGGCPSWIRRDGTLGACPEAKGTWAR